MSPKYFKEEHHGEELPVDASISDFIKKLNFAGYQTKSSCSGLYSEHKDRGDWQEMSDFGYISFKDLTENQIKKLKNAIAIIGFYFEDDQVIMSYMSAELATARKYKLSIKELALDENIKATWDKFKRDLFKKRR